jgi:hypothetical protein
MDEWVSLFLSALVGLVTGVATGFYFERRQTKAARKDAEQLRADNDRLESLVSGLRDQVRGVQTNLTTHIARPRTGGGVRPTSAGPKDIAPEIFDFVRRRIDASGAVERSMIVEHFYRQHGIEAVDAGILSLTETGRISADKKFVRVKR